MKSTLAQMTVAPKTLDLEARTVDAVLSTSDPTLVVEEDVELLEALLSDGMDLPELVPLKNTHREGSIDDILGSVVNIRREGDLIVGTLVFSAAEDDVFIKVAEGHIRFVSVGYERLEAEPTGENSFATTKSRLHEVSLVERPANIKAVIRQEATKMAADKKALGTKGKRSKETEDEETPKDEGTPPEEKDGEKSADEEATETPAEGEETSDEEEEETPSEAKDGAKSAVDLVRGVQEAHAAAEKARKDARAASEQSYEAGDKAYTASVLERAKVDELLNAEVTRAEEIVNICTVAGRPGDAGKYIKERKSAQEVATIMKDTQSKDTPIVGRSAIVVDEHDKFQKHMVGAVRARYGKRAKDCTAAPVTLQGLLRECLSRDGVNGVHSASGRDLLLLAKRSGGAHTTSDFSLIMNSVVRAQMDDGWNEYPGIWREIATTINLVDFRPLELHAYGSLDQLDEIHEDEDVPYGTGKKGKKELIQASQHAKILRLSDELIINDDESMKDFGDLGKDFSLATHRTIEMWLFWLLKAGKTMNEDAVNTWRTANNVTGATKPPTVATLDAVRAKFSAMKNLDGAILNVPLGFILVPDALDTVARELVNSTANPAGAHSGVANVFKGLHVKSSPYLDNAFTLKTKSGPVTSAANATSWYGFVQPGMGPRGLVVGLMHDSPVITEETNIGFLGRQYQCSMPFGVSIGDWRAMVKVNNHG